MDKIKEKFSLICDTRHQSYVEHKLSDILVITMCAVLCGIDSLSGIISYAEKIAEIITGIMKESIEDTGNVVAVDGKAIQSTAEKGKPHSTLQVLTAYYTEGIHDK